MAAHLLQRPVEVVDLEQRADFHVVGEQQIDVAADQFNERVAVAVDAERIGQRERDLAPRAVRHARGLQEGRLGLRRVPEVALQIGHLGAPDHVRVQVLGHQVDRGAQIGAHGALGVGGDEDQAARGRRPLGRRRGLEGNAGGPDVVPEDAAQLVVAHLADEGAAPAERSQPRHGVGRRAARDLDRRAHGGVERLGARAVDQGHGALGQVLGLEEGLVGLGQHVDDGVADADDVEGLVGHARRFRAVIWFPDEPARKARARSAPGGRAGGARV